MVWMTYLAVLDLVVIFVLRTRGVLANVFSLSQLSDKDLSLIVTLSLSERELSSSFLYGEWQLTEGGMRLLGVECLSQCRQIYRKTKQTRLASNHRDGYQKSSCIPVYLTSHCCQTESQDP